MIRRRVLIGCQHRYTVLLIAALCRGFCWPFAPPFPSSSLFFFSMRRTRFIFGDTYFLFSGNIEWRNKMVTKKRVSNTCVTYISPRPAFKRTVLPRTRGHHQPTPPPPPPSTLLFCRSTVMGLCCDCPHPCTYTLQATMITIMTVLQCSTPYPNEI